MNLGAAMADKIKKPNAKQRKDSAGRMSVWGHLKELRTCLVIIAVTYLAASAVCYCFAPVFVSYAMGLAKGYTGQPCRPSSWEF